MEDNRLLNEWLTGSLTDWYVLARRQYVYKVSKQKITPLHSLPALQDPSRDHIASLPNQPHNTHPDKPEKFGAESVAESASSTLRGSTSRRGRRGGGGGGSRRARPRSCAGLASSFHNTALHRRWGHGLGVRGGGFVRGDGVGARSA
jgi:hypothetical protein